MFKKKNLLILAFTFFFAFMPLQAKASIEISTSLDLEGKSFIEMYTEISRLKSKLSSAEIDLKFLKEDFVNEYQNKLDVQLEEVSRLKTEIETLQADIETAKQEDPYPTERITELANQLATNQESVIAMEAEIITLEEQKDKANLDNKNEIAQKEQEISELKLDIEKAKEIAWEELVNTVTRWGLYLGVILFVLFSSRITKKGITKHGEHLTSKRKEVLFRVINVVVYSIVAITIFTALFSQFAAFLPFLALLGTGLAFAVRDVISSFLAWFFIGMKHGYKVGDLIEIGTARGWVKDIHLIHTILRETGERGPTGKVLSVPNKVIFQDTLRNFSAMYRYTWVIIDFMLDSESNVEKMKKILTDTVNEQAGADLEEINKHLPSLSNKFGLNETTIKPQIFVELDPKGIKVKLKIFCRLEKRHILRTGVSEAFLAKIQKEKDINLRFLMA